MIIRAICASRSDDKREQVGCRHFVIKTRILALTMVATKNRKQRFAFHVGFNPTQLPIADHGYATSVRRQPGPQPRPSTCRHPWLGSVGERPAALLSEWAAYSARARGSGPSKSSADGRSHISSMKHIRRLIAQVSVDGPLARLSPWQRPLVKNPKLTHLSETNSFVIRYFEMN